MAHVLDCFDRHAENWINEIVEAVNATDSPIIKVRAGYILDELLGLSLDTVERWTECTQRGGSRKLDPKAPYGSVYSEKWMIALNAG
jgi:predicted transcriptional regulator of viral defense system